MKNLFKKSLLSIIIILFLSISFTLPTFAYKGRGVRDSGACPNYLGLTSWDCGVEIKNEDTLKSGVWVIAANIATDITVITAYLILGYVAYGGYLYIFSGGEPGKVARGKKTLTQAFIGLAIVMLANVILNTIRIAIGANFTLTGDCTAAACIEPNDAVINVITWVIGIAGVVAIIFVVYGGILYITSTGDPGKIKKAKDAILYALIGLAIVALAQVITAFVSSKIREANNASAGDEDTSYINNAISLKGGL